MPAIGPEGLIAAARELLKKKPPSQIMRLDIARAAGVDPALIRYYFGNKEQLLLAAVTQAEHEFREHMRANTAQGHSASEKIRRRIAALIGMLFDDPALHHLIIERIIHSHSKSARDLREDLVHGGCRDLASIIEEGVATGEFQDADSRFLFLALIGACSFPMGERALFSELIGKEPTREHSESYANFISDLFVNGLAGSRESSKTPKRKIS